MLLIDNLVVFANWWIAEHVFHLETSQLIWTMIVVSLLALTVLPGLSAHYITEPIRLIRQAILHVAPGATAPPADIRKTRFGKDLITSLVAHVYKLASTGEHPTRGKHTPAIPKEHYADQIVQITYTNWRGETAERQIVPLTIWRGKTKWHPEEQWLLTAYDVDKNAERDFAMQDIHDWHGAVPQPDVS